MKWVMTVDEAKNVCRNRSVWRSVLSDYPARDIGYSVIIIKIDVIFFTKVFTF